VQHFIHLSMALGQIICVLDEDGAAERDRRMIAGNADPARVLPAGPPPRLGPGLLTDHPDAGLPMPQGRVRHGGRTGLADTVVAGGFWLLVRTRSLLDRLAPAQTTALGAVGAVLLALDDPDFEDLDGVYRGWLEAHGACSALIRPDGYLYGAAADGADMVALVEQLIAALAPRVDPLDDPYSIAEGKRDAGLRGDERPLPRHLGPRRDGGFPWSAGARGAGLNGHR
jgi:hypothetical protein